MTTAHEVTCVSISNREDPYLRVTHLGGQDPRGRLWRLTLNQAIEGILEGRWQFFVNVDGQRQSLTIDYSPTGYRYLRAESDPDEPVTLLTLNECKN